MPDNLRSLRRTQIVRAARAIVAKDGLEALTIAELEKRLDFTRGVISYHFKNKEEIIDALLRSAIDEIDAATKSEVAAATTREERIGAVIGAVVRGFISRVEAVRILVSFWGRIHADPSIRKVNAALYARYRAQAAELLGGRKSDEALATVIVGVVLGIAAQAYFDPGKLAVDDAIEEATSAVMARLAKR